MKSFLLVLILFFQSCSLYAKAVDIIMWHSLAGYLGQELQQMVDDFNQSQQEAIIKLVYKGDYIDSLTSFAAAFRAGQPPVLIQVFEVGTATMLSPQGIIKPVHEIMKENGYDLPESSFLPALRQFYSQNGQLQALPFNNSIPVIFYNADALAKVGYNQDNFPKTWDEMEILAAKLKKNGVRCGYSSAYPSWIQVESFSALHGLPLIDSLTRKAIYNNQAVVHHLERLKRWQAQHYFEYGGRVNDATVLFTSGRCAMFSQSSGSFNSLSRLVKFKLGAAMLPIDTSASRQRYTNVAGGAALWAVNGHSAAVYHAVALFYNYLALPQTQQRWHQKTGYIPIGLEGIYGPLATKSTHPTIRLAQIDLAGTSRQKAYYHLGPQNQIRAINDEAMEAIFAGIKTPAKALDDAVVRANYVIRRFAKNTGSGEAILGK